MLFFGTQFQTVDPKGRIVLPARFKRLLTPADQDTLVLNVGREPCLLLFPLSEWARLAQELDALPKNEAKRDTIRSISDSTVYLELDASGRLTIPRDFLERVGIEREVAVVGHSRYIEVFSRASYEKDRERRREASSAILDRVL